VAGRPRPDAAASPRRGRGAAGPGGDAGRRRRLLSDLAACATSRPCSARSPRPRPPGGWWSRSPPTSSAWQAGAHADGLLLVDIDGTLVAAHSDKQGAAGTYKGGFGFYPLVCFLDRQDGTGEALAGILRPGNAGSNTAADHIEVVDLALAQLPTAARDQPIVVRADTGGATHAFTSHLRERGVRFSISLPADERVRAAVLAVPHGAWQPSVDADDQPRDGAEVAELSSLDLAGWPQGTRAICRREDPPRRPGASPTPTGTASRSSSPTKTATSPCWSCATASAPASRIASAAARPRACATCRLTSGAATPSGWSWSWPPVT
jgi:hypothetical protein